MHTTLHIHIRKKSFDKAQFVFNFAATKQKIESDENEVSTTNFKRILLHGH